MIVFRPSELASWMTAWPTGRSAAFWMKLVDLKSTGDLTTLMNEGKYTWYRDKEGKWTVRNDVIRWDVRTSKEEIGSGGPLSATSQGGMIGPEIPFGFVMGEFHDEQVLIIDPATNTADITTIMGLPSDIRKLFDNDPGEFFEFATNPANAGKMAELGLAPSTDPDTGDTAPVESAPEAVDTEKSEA